MNKRVRRVTAALGKGILLTWQARTQKVRAIRGMNNIEIKSI